MNDSKNGFIHSLRPGYHETDQSGIVHHSVYFKWFEDGRVAFFRDRGMNFRDLELNQRVGMAVHHADVKYRVPARFDELLKLEVWVGELRRASVRFDYRLWRGELLLADARIGIACIHLDRMSAIRIPADVASCCQANS